MAAFGKFVEAASTALTRASQFTGELRGTVSKSQYPDDIIFAFNQADILKKICEKLQSGVLAWINPNPADRVQDIVLEKFDAKKQPKQTTSEVLGKVEEDLAGELPHGDSLGMMLSQYGQALVEIGGSERLLATEIQKNFVVITKHFLDTIWPSVNTQRRNLEFVRLDYDSAKQKKEACTAQTKIRALEAAFDTAKEKYDQQIANTRMTVEQLKPIQENIREGLKSMASAQMRYYNACQEQLRQLTGKLVDDQHA